MSDLLLCPSCEQPIPAVDTDWSARRATCHRCRLDLELSAGYLEPPPEVLAEQLKARPGLSKPSSLPLTRMAAPGVESFKLGGALGKAQLRFEPGQLVFKGFWGRERSTPLEEIRGFAALQQVLPSGPRRVSWQVVAVLSGADRLRLWEPRDGEEARYLASELNATLELLRST